MSESASSALDVNSATQAFSSLLTPPDISASEVDATQVDQAQQDADASQAVEPDGNDAGTEGNQGTEAANETPKTFTIKVDGKDVEVSEADLAEAYKSGLRQDDYTKKTMAVAEERKAADAERQKAAQERTNLAQTLQHQHAVVQALLEEQNQIDWMKLADSDPVEFMKQKHLLEQRQAAAQRIQGEHQKLLQQHQAEQKVAHDQFIQQQREELAAKLPDWSDAAKAKAEQAAIGESLKSHGFTQQEIDNVVDHRHVLIARKAMLYDQMVSKASTAAKKVAALPAKVEKPGVTQSGAPDQRSAAFQRLNKTGRVEDAAAVFGSFL